MATALSLVKSGLRLGGGRFLWLDDMTLTGKPVLPDPWLPVHFDDRRFLVGEDPGDDTTADSKLSKALAETAIEWAETMNWPWILDIETWTTLYSSGAAYTDASIARLAQIARWGRAHRPNVPIGLYGIMPNRSHDSAIANTASWRADNIYLRELATSFDFICPSFYVLNNNKETFRKALGVYTRIARLYNKPLYPYVWPLFHPATAGGVGGTYIGEDFWKMILQFCRDNCNGVIVAMFTGAWDANAAFYTVANTMAQADL